MHVAVFLRSCAATVNRSVCSVPGFFSDHFGLFAYMKEIKQNQIINVRKEQTFQPEICFIYRLTKING